MCVSLPARRHTLPVGFGAASDPARSGGWMDVPAGEPELALQDGCGALQIANLCAVENVNRLTEVAAASTGAPVEHGTGIGRPSRPCVSAALLGLTGSNLLQR
jgi:hypothetical protein